MSFRRYWLVLLLVSMTVTTVAVGASPSQAHARQQTTVSKDIASTSCGGLASAPSGKFGPESRSDTAVFGSPTTKMTYWWEIKGFNLMKEPEAAVQGMGFDKTGKRVWLGNNYKDKTSGFITVPWGNRLAYPRIRAKSLKMYSFSVRWKC